MYDHNEMNNNEFTQPEYHPAPGLPVYPEPQKPNGPPPKKRNNFATRFAAIAVTVVLGCTSLGVGLGLGSGLYAGLASGNSEAAVETTTEQAVEAAAPAITFKPDANIRGEELTEDINPGITMSNMAMTVSDTDVVSVIKQVSNSVVSINVSGTYRIFDRSLAVQSAGSGIICAEDNANIYIVTNYHVVGNAEAVEISIDDDISVAAAPVGSDAENDIAVIKVAKGDLIAAGIEDYKIAEFGNSENMEVGETVIAIGNALGQGKSATLGIISAKNKQITSESNNYIDVIQTDAAINEGNSGGALINIKGQVIGVNTAKLAATGVEGMGYAIPSDNVKAIVEEIMAEGSVERPYMGISGATVTDRIMEVYSLNSYGVYVAGLSENSGAREAGMKAGDIITSFNGVSISDMEMLQDEIAKTKVGDVIEVRVFRDNAEVVLNIEMRDSNAYKSF